MTSPPMSPPTTEQISVALDGVQDPEIHRPITELGMVKDIAIAADGAVRVQVWLTVAGCPLRDTITREVTAAVGKVAGVSSVSVELDVMSEEQRRNLQTQLRGGRPEPQIPFAQPSSLTRVYAVASGKGGVGKSSVTVNLAAALAAAGLKVGGVDADIKGNTPGGGRGPMLHRALQQFLAGVVWGDLDVLLLDLPPGTGDIAISVAQLIPNAEIVVVTTPQQAAAEVAARAGSIALQTRQRIAGVIENMSYLVLPDGSTLQVFGEGGGVQVAERLSRAVGADVPLLGQI